MMTPTFSVTDLRHDTNAVLDSLAGTNTAYIIKNSKPTAALVKIEYLMALEAAYENMLDTKDFDNGLTQLDQAVPLNEFLTTNRL